MSHIGASLEISFSKASFRFEYQLYLSGMHQVSNKLVYNDERRPTCCPFWLALPKDNKAADVLSKATTRIRYNKGW